MINLIRVVNTSRKKPLTLRHDQDGNVTIPPGKDAIVPLSLALVNLGNPAAMDEGRNYLRRKEIERIQTLWGFYPGLYPDAAWDEQVEDPHRTDGAKLGPFKPTAECYRVDGDGERFYMIHDDPTGEYASGDTVAEVAAATSQVHLIQQMEEMQRQIATLTSMLGNRDGLPNERDPDPDDEDDVEDLIGQAIVEAQKAGAQGEAVHVDVSPDASVVAPPNRPVVAPPPEPPSPSVSAPSRDDIPEPPAGDDKVTKDSPRTTKSSPRAK